MMATISPSPSVQELLDGAVNAHSTERACASGLQPPFSSESLCHVSAAPRDMEGWLAVAAGAKPVTYFVFEVRKGVSTYYIRRRYRDFDRLHVALSEAYGRAGHTLPALPPKQLFGKNEDASFLSRRQQQLAAYLAELLDDKVVSMSPELCAFLEAEAGTQLSARNETIATCTALALAELADDEAARQKLESELEVQRDALVRLNARAFAAEREAAANAEAASLEHARFTRARALALGVLLREREARRARAAIGAALGAWATRAAAVRAAKTVRAAEVERAEKVADDPLQSVSLETPRKVLGTPTKAPAEESLLKAGLLLKQGAGNRSFQERFFELVRLDATAFLVYYDSAARESVKGYVPLDGATVAPEPHATQPNCLLVTAPARRLSLFTPGIAPGPLGCSPLKALGERMTLLEKAREIAPRDARATDARHARPPLAGGHVGQARAAQRARVGPAQRAGEHVAPGGALGRRPRAVAHRAARGDRVWRRRPVDCAGDAHTQRTVRSDRRRGRAVAHRQLGTRR